MSRIAVIGSGIAGLSAAYYLSRKHDVTLLERDTRLGGHTNTVVVDSSKGPLPVDTGFIVHNRVTYPSFCRLMEELGVATQPSDMSFAVTSPGGQFEYSSRGVSGYFAQRSNALSLGHYQFLAEVLRFNREAPRLLQQPESSSLTMAAFLQRGGYSQQFVERYLYPMASAVWSMAPEEMDGFPALTLVQFFHNHGMLGVHTHPSWLTIRGGSHSYLEPITRPYKASIHRGVEIGAVRRLVDSVEISILGRPPRKFDEVVFACHGDQVLPLLADATDTERDVFSQFQTSRNEACLHTDGAMLPRRPAARASWNYLIGDKRKVTLTYDMNRLQRLPTEETYCVSLNANGRIAQEKAVARMVYHHPLYTSAAVAAQERWSEVSGVRRTHFCGAYWFYGFHEDGVRSALRVASSLGVTVQ